MLADNIPAPTISILRSALPSIKSVYASFSFRNLHCIYILHTFAHRASLALEFGNWQDGATGMKYTLYLFFFSSIWQISTAYLLKLLVHCNRGGIKWEGTLI
jgi:hypothetical protein